MSLEPPVGTVGRREDHGVNTVTSQDIPKKLAGKFMVNLVIGSHLDYQMTKSRAYVAAILDDNRQRINNTPVDTFTKEQLEILQKLFS